MRPRIYVFAILFAISVGSVMANDIVDPDLMAKAEGGDAQAALKLYGIYGYKMNDAEAAKYWLKVAAIHGSAMARMTFASSLDNQGDFEKSLSKRWLDEIDGSDLDVDQLARYYSLKSKIYVDIDQDRALLFSGYAAYLNPDAHKIGLVEYCNELKDYRCVYVWSKYLFSDMEPRDCKLNCVTAHAPVLCTGGYHEQNNEQQRSRTATPGSRH